ncbi:MAG: hypothetical protein IKX33_00630 [Prevotella sp.]|nr:hypothetical protein [Prevotella sp.]
MIKPNEQSRTCSVSAREKEEKARKSAKALIKGGKICQSMIFRMKHIIITFFLFVSISTIGNGQNTMRLDEYSISSSQLDSIINMVLCDVGDKDYINVSAERNESNIYTIYVSAFSSDLLRYSTKIIGYSSRGDKTIFFRASVKDMITKKTDGHKKTVRCSPPPNKNDVYLYVPALDGGKEWIFQIDNGKIILLRKILEW